MKNMLVTGGLGHIGSNFIRTHRNVTVVDNLLTQRYCSLFDLDSPIKFYDKCISEITIKDLEDIDIVIHLAAITNADESFENKEQTEKINFDLTSKFIDICEKAKCSFIFFSSTSVYGVSADIVYEDNDSFLNPQSPYAETKIKIEKKLRNYQNDYLILRFGTIFGTSTGMRFHTVINKFCYEASLGKPLTIWRENFEQYRPYLGLNDAINSIHFFLENLDKWNETYNVLTKNYKLSEIIKIIENIILPSQSQGIEMNIIDTPLLNQFSYKVSNKKLKKLGWESKDNLIDSITHTLSKLRNLNG